MNLTCKKNPAHTKFTATAHVTEDWVVDVQGNFIEVSPYNRSEVTHEPSVGDSFNCFECGAEAEATRG
jgi:hypothetical protein